MALSAITVPPAARTAESREAAISGPAPARSPTLRRRRRSRSGRCRFVPTFRCAARRLVPCPRPVRPYLRSRRVALDGRAGVGTCRRAAGRPFAGANRGDGRRRGDVAGCCRGRSRKRRNRWNRCGVPKTPVVDAGDVMPFRHRRWTRPRRRLGSPGESLFVDASAARSADAPAAPYGSIVCRWVASPGPDGWIGSDGGSSCITVGRPLQASVVGDRTVGPPTVQVFGFTCGRSVGEVSCTLAIGASDGSDSRDAGSGSPPMRCRRRRMRRRRAPRPESRPRAADRRAGRR